VVIIDPRRVLEFVWSMGQLPRPTISDARVLAGYGERIHPPVRELPDEQNQALRGLWVRREQLNEMLVMEENQLEHAPRTLQRRLRAHIDHLRKQIKQTDNEPDRAVRNSRLWNEYELRSSVSEVRPVLSIALLADLPEWGPLNRREIAARGAWRRSIAIAVRCAAAQDPGGGKRLRRVRYSATSFGVVQSRAAALPSPARDR
jgi:transposase